MARTEALRMPESLQPLEHLAVGGAYRAQQAAIRMPLLATRTLLGAFKGSREAPPGVALAALRREYEALLERDLAHVREGAYPRSLLFQIPWSDYAWSLPRFLADLPRVVRRSGRNEWKELPDTGPRRFPRYFQRTFHWQTDGYLSRRSARVYDVSVELLFMGCADVMRRQVIPPMTRFAKRARTQGPLRILDVGCGTGRSLSQIATALPGHALFGIDLSPWYLEEARRKLVDVPDVSLVAEQAENLPFRDDYFDIVTSTYLFHELPRKVRGKVAAELARVLRPGGLLVVEDSAQLSEASDLTPFLSSFSELMHEPYYRDYLRDDLEARIAEAGFRVDRCERAWLSKVVTAELPKG